MLTAGYWIAALLLAAVAVCWSYVLVQPGMLLAPVQSWVRAKWYNRKFYLQAEAACSKLKAKLSRHEPDNGPDSVQVQQMAMIRAQIAFERDLDTRWWWAPLWGCYLCVAGQLGFWGYLLLGGQAYHVALAHPGLGEAFAALLSHFGFTAITILFAAVWRAVYAWSQNQ